MTSLDLLSPRAKRWRKAHDANDCAALTRRALATFGDALDAARGACYGGSHGGFLTAWLLGVHADLYPCGGVLWNPQP